MNGAEISYYTAGCCRTELDQPRWYAVPTLRGPKVALNPSLQFINEIHYSNAVLNSPLGRN